LSAATERRTEQKVVATKAERARAREAQALGVGPQRK
jgi:hypothetical protein